MLQGFHDNLLNQSSQSGVLTDGRQHLDLKLRKLRFRLIHLFGYVNRQVCPNRKEQGKNLQMQDLLSDAFARHIYQGRLKEFHISQAHFSFS